MHLLVQYALKSLHLLEKKQYLLRMLITSSNVEDNTMSAFKKTRKLIFLEIQNVSNDKIFFALKHCQSVKILQGVSKIYKCF